MFFLSLDEKVSLSKATVEAASGRVPVICSGHTSDSLQEQVRELLAMSETGVEAVVMITNRLAAENEDDRVFLKNLDYLLVNLPSDLPLGFYECPYPYKRLLPDAILKSSTYNGRFTFLKDTSCDSALIAHRLELMKGTGFKLFNANASTLSLSLSQGGNGYSGVMANFHPKLYKQLFTSNIFDSRDNGSLQNLLGTLSSIEDSLYPMTAKYHLKKLGILDSIYTRKHKSSTLDENHMLMVDQMHALVQKYEI
jgi:4-hydroxy-tetrahydrodipicolinate synthase